jgi:N-acyl-L-homoserine lactone synthetase
MNENDLLAETVVNGYRVTTYDDHVLYHVAVTREISPPDDQIWEMGRFFTPEEAANAHARIVSEIIRGTVPEAEA